MKHESMDRRRFLKRSATTTALAAAAATAAIGRATTWSASAAAPTPRPLPEPTAARLPRWRGFNLLEKFTAGQNQPFRESDFEWIAEFGFNFVRLPLSYQCWADPASWRVLREPVLKEIDQAVEFGRKQGVHVNVNLHRAPGYCVNPPKEPLDLWTQEEGLEACAFHWAHLAKRYRGRPNTEVTFDLLNEPPDVAEETYVRVVRRLVEAIRAEDPARLVIADGLKWGTVPVHGLAGLGVAQSTRGYRPMEISHYKASWVRGSDSWAEPSWPLRPDGKDAWNKERLRRECIEPWQALARKGVGVHVGECGAFQHTPHAAVLAWFRDYLGLWKEAGWGYALWNFRGSFGILDSRRTDVAYEDFRGHKLDRALLTLLQEH
jgi:endoglucanase